MALAWSEWPTDLLEAAEVDAVRAVAAERRAVNLPWADPELLAREEGRLQAIRDELLRRAGEART